MKKAFIVHRWDGKPDSDWYPWLKKELEKKGYEVEIPEMPNTESPKIEEWLPYLEKFVGNIDEEMIFIGHSVGCQAILRLLKKAEGKVSAVSLVAPWTRLVNLDFEEASVARPWLETPIDWKNVKNKAEKFVAFLSDNDPWVPVTQAEFFQKKLGAQIFIEHNTGHFTEDDGVVKLPQLADQINDTHTG
jgi:uncharacterized protein